MLIPHEYNENENAQTFFPLRYHIRQVGPRTSPRNKMSSIYLDILDPGCGCECGEMDETTLSASNTTFTVPYSVDFMCFDQRGTVQVVPFIDMQRLSLFSEILL